MSLKGRLRIEVIFSVLQNTLEGYSGVFKNTFKWRGGGTFSAGMFFGLVSPES